MNYIKYILIALLTPCFLQAVKKNNSLNDPIDKTQVWSNCTGLVTVGLWGSFEKIGKFPLGPITKIVGIVPSFFIGKKAVEYTMNFSQEVLERLKIRQK